MQAVGTLRGIRVISLLVLLVSLIGYAYSIPLQYLPNIPGYVPVYIRYGDEPLEDINPELAEAFGETSNSAKLDSTLAHVSNSFKDNDIDALLEESTGKHAYPLRVRATESRSFATVGNDELGNGNSNKPKLLTIYELPDDNDNRRNRRRNRGRGRSKEGNRRAPAVKVSPLSDAEKEELEKLAIEVEKEETKPNELYAPSSKSSELLRAMPRNQHKANKFVAPIKLQNPLDESSTDLPEIDSQIEDLAKPSGNRNIAASKAVPDCETNTTSRGGKREPPIKNQRPASILSNVEKLSPIDLPDESTPEEDKTRNFTEANDEVSPLSDAEKEKLEKLAIEVEKEETKPNEFYAPSSKSSELPRAMPHNRHKANKFVAPIKLQNPLDEFSTDLPEIDSQIEDLAKPSGNRNIAASKADCETNTTSRGGKREPPIKNQRPASILSNVEKLSPIDLPDESTPEEDKTRNSTEANDEVAME